MYLLGEVLNLDKDYVKSIEKNLVSMYIVEGYSLAEASKLAEGTITPDIIKDIDKNPDYKKINKDLDYAGEVLDDLWHRDPLFAEDFLTDVKGSFEKEANVCDAVADFIGGMRLKGFDKETVSKTMPGAAKSYQYLKNRANRLRKDIANMDVSVYDASVINPQTGEKEYKINPKVSRKPGEAVRDALKALREVLTNLGVKNWDYDYFLSRDKKSLKAGVELQGSIVFESIDLEQIDCAGIKATIDQAVAEGIYDKRALLGIAESLELDKKSSDYLRAYVYYILN